MDFQDWMLLEQHISPYDYFDINIDQLRNADIELDHHELHKHTRPPLKEIDLKSTFGKSPFGVALTHKQKIWPAICTKLGISTVAELVEAWQTWSVENRQPIAHQLLDTVIGKSLYAAEPEMRLVADFVCGGRPAQRGPLIYSTDRVVLPEGASTFYIGIELAARQLYAGESSVTAITSNQPLIQEFFSNPVFAKSFSAFHIIGGHAHGPGFTNGGVFGSPTYKQYTSAIRKDPKSNVVIIPVSRLVPELGPFAKKGESHDLKKSLLAASEDWTARNGKIIKGVREVVFVTDWRKHVPTNEQCGGPLFGPDEWADWLRDNRTRASLVTTPPPNLRRAISESKVDRNIPSRSIADVPDEYKLGRDDLDYRIIAKKLHEEFGGRMYEAIEFSPPARELPQNPGAAAPAVVGAATRRTNMSGPASASQPPDKPRNPR